MCHFSFLIGHNAQVEFKIKFEFFFNSKKNNIGEDWNTEHLQKFGCKRILVRYCRRVAS